MFKIILKYISFILLFQFTHSENIRGINWFGFETEYSNLMCSWSHTIDWNLNKMLELDFNYIRLPFSLEFIHDNNFGRMDEFFELTKEKNISVLLDFHRLEKTHQSATPYNNKYTFDNFLDGWITILDRYKDYPNLEAVDIFNEYQSENYVEWNSLARQIVSHIESYFPSRFSYYVGGTRWGGDIHFMDLDDLGLDVKYTIHKYWFSDEPPRKDKWEYSFGIEEHNATDIMVGEFGFISSNKNEVDFFKEIIEFLHSENIKDTFFWTWSFNSGDTGGILKEDCESIDYVKIDLLKKLWYEERRNLRANVPAIGSPGAVSGTGFILKNLILV